MTYIFGEFELDTALYELRCGGEPCQIEPQVFDVLAYLIQRRSHVVTKQELLDHVWPDCFVTEATLSSRLMAARKAIGDNGREQRLIRTLHGRGFRFIADVEERSARTEDPGQGTVAVKITEEQAAAIPEMAASRAVAREAEFALLDGWLEAALGGKRRMVFVTGEAGVGKTTLVSAFAERVRATTAFWFGYGQCMEQRGSGEAYMPVLEAFGRMCKGSGGETLVSLLARQAPTWLAQMPWLVGEADLEKLRQRNVGATRERMLREMAEAVDAMTAEKPLLLVLEDLHWSDNSTLDLLELLARRQEPARLLLLGTYRPADAKTSGHPLHAMAQKLKLRGHCEELALGLLSEAGVREYLAIRFPRGDLSDSLAPVLHDRTDGNPLFMENVLDHWMGRGWIKEASGEWRLEADLERLAVGVPDSLQQMADQQMEELEPESQETLEAASVCGIEFSAAAAAAGVERPVSDVEARCAALARKGLFLRLRGTAEWPDGTFAARYGFIHGLLQEVIYDRTPAGRRAQLHRRIGARLETARQGAAREGTAELAVHFVKGRDTSRALKYLYLAAQQALECNAYQEAIRHLRAGLDILSGLPDSSERDEQELLFQATLGPTMIATKGWSAPEAEGALLRARELCGLLGSPRQLSAVLYGLAAMHEFRGQYTLAQKLIEQRIHLPGVSKDSVTICESHDLLACSLFHQGVFADCVENADLALGAYDARLGYDSIALYGENPIVGCYYWSGLSLWFLGYADRALERIRKALAMAENHSYSLAGTRVQAAILHQCRREPLKTAEWAEAAIALGNGQGYPYRVATGKILLGWALSTLGRFTEGIALLREGLAGHRATGAHMDRPYYLALMAEAYSNGDRAEEALFPLAEALDLVRGTRSFFYEAELYRLQGVLLLRAGLWDTQTAEASFQRALEVARRQNAKSLELRAAMSLARLWNSQQKGEKARELLAGLYRWFTEGLDTPDLLQAKAMLERPAIQLRVRAGG